MPSGKFRPDPTMCRNGLHKLAEVGQWKDGRCAECARLWLRKYHVPPQPKVAGLGKGRWRENPELCRAGKHKIAEVGQQADGRCKACASEWYKSYRVEHKAKLNEQQRDRFHRNYVPHPKPARTHCIHGHDLAVVGINADGHCAQCRRDRQHARRATSGRPRITQAEYDRDYTAQEGKCAICCRTETRLYGKQSMRLTRDHNHVTKENRGLICHNCNAAIGMVNENIDTLQFMIEYLKLWGTKHSAIPTKNDQMSLL